MRGTGKGAPLLYRMAGDFSFQGSTDIMNKKKNKKKTKHCAQS